MNGKDSFVEDEERKIRRAVAMIDDLLTKKDLS
jgi:hypothetical protein